MQNLRFSRLSLLSHNERRGLQVDFSKTKTVLVAGNGFGKSAVLKSLYDSFGARPHKIDKSWANAKVTSLLEFSISDSTYSIIKLSLIHI